MLLMTMAMMASGCAQQRSPEERASQLLESLGDGTFDVTFTSEQVLVMMSTVLDTQPTIWRYATPIAIVLGAIMICACIVILSLRNNRLSQPPKVEAAAENVSEGEPNENT